MKELVVNKIVKKGRCTTKGCNNKPTGKFCGTCRSRISRLKDPIRYSFNNVKNRAKQRDIFFDLTLDQFRQFCYETEYIKGKGKTVGSFDIDRIIEGKFPGYTITNIQKLEKVQNIKKYYNHYLKKTVTEIKQVVENLPF